MHRALIIGLAFLVALAGCKAEGQPDKVLRFSAIPDHNTTELIEKYTPVAEYLSETLGVNVEYAPATDYTAAVEMFRNGEIHLAWFGGLTGCQARKAVEGARAIAQGIEDPNYYSYFIAHKDVAIERTREFPAAIADLKFTFGDKGSTSGRLMPEYFIRKHGGKPPEDFFKEQYGFSGAHDKTIELVNAGTYQAGACNYKTFDKMKAGGKANNVRIIWITPFYADYNFTAHPELEEIFGPGFIDKLQAAILAIDPEMARRAFSRGKLISAKNGDFATIEETARELKLLR